ncbi:nicotinamide-nucleotide amidohydrolase family protein, partial [Acinetobacter baumannii]
MATAESCTGGWVSMALTSIAGSSDWFDRGFVTYSNVSKQDMLGVLSTTLSLHGAVSAQTAQEMAEGALKQSSVDYSLS